MDKKIGSIFSIGGEWMVNDNRFWAVIREAGKEEVFCSWHVHSKDECYVRMWETFTNPRNYTVAFVPEDLIGEQDPFDYETSEGMEEKHMKKIIADFMNHIDGIAYDMQILKDQIEDEIEEKDDQNHREEEFFEYDRIFDLCQIAFSYLNELVTREDFDEEILENMGAFEVE
jgi:hypothetical protein